MPDRAERAKFDDLYLLVSAQLIDGHYRPGDRIGLKDLAARLRVSVTPLREVLSRLVGRDLVIEHRNEGYYSARLDARDISGLYALHLTCLERALGDSVDFAAGEEETDIWTIFRSVVENSGDAILADVHRYLAGRLALLRRYDTAMFGDARSVATELRRLLSIHELGQIVDWIRAFHDQRIASAAEMALRFGRGRPSG